MCSSDLAKARSTNKKLVIGYILRHHPSWIKFIEIAQTLGKPLVMRMNLNQQSSGAAWETHRNLISSISPIVDCGVHYVDVMCQMTRSKPVRVSGLGARLTNDIPEDKINYGHLHLKGGETTYRYGALSFLAPRDFVRLWADEGVGAKHLDFRLPAAGGTLSLTDAGGSEFELTTYPPQVEDVSSGRFPDGSATIRTFPDAASPGVANYLSSNPGLVFNELLAEFGGAGPGWVEIKNTSGSIFNLTGHSLAVGDRDGLRWPFPNGLTIPVNGHLVITCDGLRPASSTPADLNSGIALSPLGEELYLFDDAGHEIDRLVFGFQVSGHSIGRISDIGSWTLLSSPTEGTPNTTSAILGLVTAVRINEWLANPASNGDDFIELFNTSATQPILLSGLRLTEDLSLSGIDQYAIPALSFIGARGFVAFTADGSSGWAHLPFNLDASGETLRLYRTTGTSIIDEVTWGIETEGVSSGRTADGGAIIAQLAFQSQIGRAHV